MRISKTAQSEREAHYKFRIKELENIICPAEQHDYVMASEEMHIIDGHGTVIYDRRYVCKRCLKQMYKTEYI